MWTLKFLGVTKSHDSPHLAKCIFCTHLLHDIRRRPYLLSQLPQTTHAIIELGLIATISLDLTWVATDNDKVKVLAQLEEFVMLLMHIVDQLATHTRIDHTWRKEKVFCVAVPTRNLIGNKHHLHHLHTAKKSHHHGSVVATKQINQCIIKRIIWKKHVGPC